METKTILKHERQKETPNNGIFVGYKGEGKCLRETMMPALEKTLIEQYTEKEYTMEQLLQLVKEKAFNARKNGLLVEFITTKPVFNTKNEIIGVTTDFPAELNIYTFK